jgi:hypothetical protein
MKTTGEKFVGELGQRLATMGELIEATILARMLSGGDTFCAYRFELAAVTLRGLMQALQRDARLWGDFRRTIEAHRPATHWTMLLEHVYTVGNLLGKLKLLEPLLACRAPEDRRQLAEQLNRIDGEVTFCQHLADRRNLAARINQALEFPLIDGLTLRGLIFVFGDDASLWSDFQALVTCSSHFRVTCNRNITDREKPHEY